MKPKKFIKNLAFLKIIEAQKSLKVFFFAHKSS